ncbi:MAG TPA: M2 family metallopeptidase [Steroidobacteraceae bacterium]|nr:M2 family metallopeptidase [Steroidobacteraceae bacterium]
MFLQIRSAAIVAASTFLLAACATSSSAPPADAQTAEPAESATEFVARVNREMQELSRKRAAANWAYATYINQDTELLASLASEEYLAYFSQAVEQAGRYDLDRLDPATRHAIENLRLGVSAPAPDDPDKRAELSRITTELKGAYGAAKYCPADGSPCLDQTELTRIMAESRDYDELAEVWTGWRTAARPMRDEYARFVELANEGARGLGIADLGEMWRSVYDMPPEEFERVAARLWDDVQPLYRELHCYVRGRLQDRYGSELVPSGEAIPAHLLGNMWAQQWAEIYDEVEPFPGVTELDVTAALESQGYDARRMTRSAEDFYVSLGFPKLPETFWERSMLEKPRDREVQCHASAWNMDGADDVRIKQCIRPTSEELTTVYHELGHVYYYLWYRDQPFLFKGGAHDGFHEAIGDTVTLSMTPEYLHRIGLAGPFVPSREAVINAQMKLALDKIAFLPFGKLIDEWRWKVFSGEITPAEYNAAWWDLRERYQGIRPPVPRSEADFDPGAKYHIPANTPYTRYFLAFILQFQFHKALCDAAGHEGPLYACSIFGDEEAGRRFGEMLALGQSGPWQDALEKLTGTREMDATAIIDYFAPLLEWLREENAGQQCGW